MAAEVGGRAVEASGGSMATVRVMVWGGEAGAQAGMTRRVATGEVGGNGQSGRATDDVCYARAGTARQRPDVPSCRVGPRRRLFVPA